MSDENEASADESAPVDAKPAMDPVRKWTFILLGAGVVLMAWYLTADRVTPYTTQARVHALVVPVATEVSGSVSDVAVTSNQFVNAGEVLFKIDSERYRLAVATAEANLQSARQATGASAANVDAAEAQVGAARASQRRAEQDAVRLQRIKNEDPGAISERRIESAVATLAVTKSQVNAAEANLDRARQDLGESGEANSRVLEAQAALGQAQINLLRTTINAPDSGVITAVRVNRGNFAQAGAPLMTFLATQDIWVQADFTENSLGNIKRGDTVELVFDALPGKIIKGTIRTTGFGVNVDSAPLGSLPTIDNDRNWLRDAQRFSVLVDFELPNADDRLGIRIGAQASVMVYTDDGFLFNTIGKLKMRLVSIFTYAY
jgi:multidrug resistance efflux pump